MGALIWVEVLDRRGHVRARHRVDAVPAIIGRGYGADVLLDDPWAWDPLESTCRHASLSIL